MKHASLNDNIYIKICNMYNKVLVVHLALKTPLDGRWQAFDPCETQPTSFLSVSYIHTSGGRDQPS